MFPTILQDVPTNQPSRILKALNIKIVKILCQTDFQGKSNLVLFNRNGGGGGGG